MLGKSWGCKTLFPSAAGKPCVRGASALWARQFCPLEKQLYFRHWRRKGHLIFRCYHVDMNLLPHNISPTFYFVAKTGKYDFYGASQPLMGRHDAPNNTSLHCSLTLPPIPLLTVLLPAHVRCAEPHVTCPDMGAHFPWRIQKHTLKSNHILKYFYQANSSATLSAPVDVTN